MRRLIAMIAAAVMAAVRTILVKCVRTGEWLVRQVLPSVSAAAPAQSVEDFVPEPEIDDTLAVTRRVAAALADGRMPELADLAAVHPPHLNWIRAMEPEMRATVAGSTDEDLRAHIRGRRTIRGLLQADAESVAAYASAKRRREVTEEEPDALPQPAYG